jgi:hypothetical protein
MQDSGDCRYRFDNRGLSCLIGRRIRSYNTGRFDTGTIVEILPNMRFGVHLDGHTAYGVPVTTDMRRSEFILPRA